MEERRQHPRMNVSLPALVRGVRKNWKVRTLDLSQGGALLDSPHPVKPGAFLELLFDFQQSTPVPLFARVLRSKPAFWGHRHALAVKFDTLKPEITKAAEAVWQNQRAV